MVWELWFFIGLIEPRDPGPGPATTAGSVRTSRTHWLPALWQVRWNSRLEDGIGVSLRCVFKMKAIPDPQSHRDPQPVVPEKRGLVLLVVELDRDRA